MLIKFYNFAKPINSTAIPTTSAAQYDCDFIGVYSIDDLTIKITDTAAVSLVNFPRYNIIELSENGRFYFADFWQWRGGFWYAHCSIDLLATFRDAILNHACYVARSAKVFDLSIPDTKYPVKADFVHKCNTLNSPWFTNLSSGVFVVSIVNNDSGAIGAVSYYAFSSAQFRAFMTYLFGSLNFTNVTEISEDLLKCLMNPFQYIKNVLWFPCSLDAAGLQTVNEIPVAYWKIPANAKRITKFQVSKSLNIAVPKHPQSYGDNIRGTWLEDAPYSSYSLEFFPWGVMPLDSKKLIGVNVLNLSYIIDVVTGAATLRVTDASTERDDEILVDVAQVGIPIAIGQISYDMSSRGAQILAAAGAAYTSLNKQVNLDEGILNLINKIRPPVEESTQAQLDASGAAMNAGLNLGGGGMGYFPQFGRAGSEKIGKEGTIGGDVLSVVKTTAFDVASAMLSGFIESSVSGSNGSTAVFSLGLRINAHFGLLADEDLRNNGRPLCKIVPLNSLSGFTKCLNPNIIIDGALRTEQETINQMLEGGVYIA